MREWGKSTYQMEVSVSLIYTEIQCTLSVDAGNLWAILSDVERNEYGQIEERGEYSRRTSAEREELL